MQVNLNCIEVFVNWLSVYLIVYVWYSDMKKEKDLFCVVDIIMLFFRNILWDLLVVYKIFIVLIILLILIVVLLLWNIMVSGNKFFVIYRSFGKFRFYLDVIFVFCIVL